MTKYKTVKYTWLPAKVNENSLNKRQKEIMKMIVEMYINEKEAISSLNIKQKKKDFKWSSATIRSEMAFLEEKGFLKKEHKSSGRIPTKEGYKLYIDSLMGEIPTVDIRLKNKLIELFSFRNESIDVTLNKSAEIISNFLNLPIILSGKNNLDSEILKKIDLVEISSREFIILAVTSSGEVYKDKIWVDEFEEKEDLTICIRLLNENLVGFALSKIDSEATKLLPKIRRSVHRYEFVYENIITKICFNVINKEKSSIYKIYNKSAIISQPEVKNNLISVEKIFHVLEDYSTFSQLNLNYFKTGRTLINLEGAMEGISVATTILNSEGKTRNISIIGPLRMDYPLIRSLFEFINEKFNLN